MKIMALENAKLVRQNSSLKQKLSEIEKELL